MTREYEIHPVALIFPQMAEKAFQDFKADIAEQGQQEAIVLYHGQILDGRHRYRACRELEIEVNTTTWHGKDPIAYVLSKNLYRRQLKTSQRAMVAARIATLPHGTNRFSKVEASIDASTLPSTKEQACALMNVSEPSVRRAKRVLKEGSDELIAAVDAGTVKSVHKAMLSLELPKEDQLAHALGKLDPSENGETQEEEETPSKPKKKSVAVERAHEAINCLTRIPKNDPKMKRGLQIVMDWIRRQRRTV